MEFQDQFYCAAFDALPYHTTIIDETGEILFINKSWKQFAQEHGVDHDWVGSSYWQLLNDDSDDVVGIESVLSGKQQQFFSEFSFITQDHEHWYQLAAAALIWQGRRLAIISHCDISAQKHTELQVRELTLQDSLTTLPNRRHFNQFFEQEWRRGARENNPLSLLFIDVDRFKHYNDCYGHQQGDECLRQIAQLLGNFAQRPGDLMARYGGEEFALILANTPAHSARRIAEKLVEAVSTLQIPHGETDVAPFVTISIGVATQIPQPYADKNQLIDDADKALYEAKKQGRNGFACAL